MTFLAAAIAAMLGATLASFLDVVADRLPQDQWPTGRSHCPKCGRPLNFIDLIPVFGFLVRGGKCVTCKTPIPRRHIAGELTLAAAFAAVLLAPGALQIDGSTVAASDPWLIGFRLLLLAVLFGIAVADLRFYIIPDVLSLGLMGLLILAHALGAFFAMPYAHILPVWNNALYGMLFGIGFLGVFSVVSRGGWMGWGDVKLAAALGLAFGFPAIIFNLAFAFMLGAVVGLLMVGLKIRGMQDLLPFGPFIVLGALPFVYGFTIEVYRLFGVADFVKILM